MPPAKTPPDQPQDEYLKTLVALQETVKESQTHVLESSEALIEAHRASLEQLAERLIEAMRGAAAERPIEVVVQPPPPAVDDQITREQRLRQRQLVLSYDAFRTMLGRAPTSGAPGAAVVFTAARVDDKGQRDPGGDSIVIPRPAPFAFVEDGWTLVAITTANQTLRAPLHRHDLPVTVQVEHLRADIDIGRLEIRDANDDPIYLGVGLATQTQNVERRRRMHHGGEGAAPVEEDDDPRQPDEGLTTSTRELDREIR
jgi:hypothetical protein